MPITTSNAPVIVELEKIKNIARTNWAVNFTDAGGGAEEVKGQPGSSANLYITYFELNSVLDGTIDVLDDSSTVLGPYKFEADGNGLMVLDLGAQGKAIQLTTNKALNINSSAACQGLVIGFTIDWG